MTHVQKNHRPFSVLHLLCSSQHPYEVSGVFIFQIRKPRLRKVTQSRDKNNHGNDVLLTTHRLTVPGMCVILLK